MELFPGLKLLDKGIFLNDNGSIKQENFWNKDHKKVSVPYSGKEFILSSIVVVSFLSVVDKLT